MREAIAYLLAIAASEAVAVFVAPWWGILCHIVVLTVIIVRSALARNYVDERLLLPLTLVPLLRIITLAMPSAELSDLWLYYVIYVPVLIAAIVLARILHYISTDIGISSERLGLQALVGLSGILLGIVGYFLLRPEPLIAVLAWREVLLAAFILLLCTGFIQEFVFRGLIQYGVVEVFGWWGIVYVSLLFAVLYMGFIPATGVAFAFVISLYFGWIVKRTDSILGVALAAGLCNIVLYLILPFWL